MVKPGGAAPIAGSIGPVPSGSRVRVAAGSNPSPIRRVLRSAGAADGGRVGASGPAGGSGGRVGASAGAGSGMGSWGGGSDGLAAELADPLQLGHHLGGRLVPGGRGL